MFVNTFDNRQIEFEVCSTSSEEEADSELPMPETYLEYHKKNRIYGLEKYSNLLGLKVACKNIKKIEGLECLTQL